MSEEKENATFYCFKGWALGRKYYTSGRGVVTKEVWGMGSYLQKILELNGGYWPGLAGPGDEYFRFVVPDEACDFGWPLMFDPVKSLVVRPESMKEE